MPCAVIWFVWKANIESKFNDTIGSWLDLGEQIKVRIALLVKYSVKEVDYFVNDMIYWLQYIK